MGEVFSNTFNKYFQKGHKPTTAFDLQREGPQNNWMV